MITQERVQAQAHAPLDPQTPIDKFISFGVGGLHGALGGALMALGEMWSLLGGGFSLTTVLLGLQRWSDPGLFEGRKWFLTGLLIAAACTFAAAWLGLKQAGE